MTSDMSTRPQKLLLGLSGLIGFVGLVWLVNLGYRLETMKPGPQPRPVRHTIEIVDSLHEPVAVKRWDERGLVLANGRRMQLPGFRRLPRASDALAEVIRDGVEVDSKGRVFGLVRVWHWCGNDRVVRHIQRINVSRLLIFRGEGDHVPVTTGRCYSGCESSRNAFSRNGMNVDELKSFNAWNEQFEQLPESTVI
jgi:hypothetical protein